MITAKQAQGKKHYALFSIPDNVFLEFGYGSASGAMEQKSSYANSHQVVVIVFQGKKYLGELNSWGKITSNPKVWKSTIVEQQKRMGW